MILQGFFVYRNVWNLMQVGSEVREISCVLLAEFQMKIHFNLEVWSKENSTGAASVIGLLTGAEIGDFWRSAATYSRPFCHFSRYGRKNPCNYLNYR